MLVKSLFFSGKNNECCFPEFLASTTEPIHTTPRISPKNASTISRT